MITQETYDKLAESYRKYPGAIDRAAKYAGVNYKTAKRAWDQGWTRAPSNQFKTIKDLLRDEEQAAQEARSAQEAAATVERERLAREAERARQLEEEAKQVDEASLRALRKDTLAGLVACASLTEGVSMLAKRVNEQLKAGVDKNGNPLDIDATKTLRILRDYALTVGRLGAIVETVHGMERVKQGLPTAIMGIDVAHVTLEDAEREVEFAQKALTRAKELGIVVHQGGAAAKKPA